MNWYRVTYAINGRPLPPVEVEAHCAEDALSCVAVHCQVDLFGEDEVTVVELRCIEEPEHVQRDRMRRAGALLGAMRLVEIATAGLWEEQ